MQKILVAVIVLLALAVGWKLGRPKPSARSLTPHYTVRYRTVMENQKEVKIPDSRELVNIAQGKNLRCRAQRQEDLSLLVRCEDIQTASSGGAASFHCPADSALRDLGILVVHRVDELWQIQVLCDG